MKRASQSRSFAPRGNRARSSARVRALPLPLLMQFFKPFQSTSLNGLLIKAIAIVVATIVIGGFANASTLHILVDPGHGGSDSGAVRGPLKESTIALKVSQQLAQMLKQDERFEVTMTRENDHKISLDQRTQIAKDVKADVLLSVHLNTNNDPRVHGEEFYFQNQLPVDEDLLYLASRENDEETDNKITNEKGDNDVRVILEDLGRNHRIKSSGDLSKVLFENWAATNQKKIGKNSIRQAPFHVVSKVNIPSVLVELGFLSNPVEGPKLAESDYQHKLAKSLYEGLVKFKETMDKDPERALHSP